ncbi:alanine racemase [Noviherbaspirillum aridicola]|uniref:Alanine racemase n=2 Tax=Noviherbaspirillum aridicola TaxID=2849687 RepID=A0ABQ4Q2Z0_9BURK|nr:alanine racemase [Noviherbaspirillum aridicola]
MPASKVWAVVKANAYGHGLERAMRAFDDADGLAMIETEAAARLRELGWQKRLLLLEGFFDASDLPLLSRLKIDTAVHCDEQIDMLARAEPGMKVDVHLKMNSGMNRLGFTPAAFRGAWERLRALPAVGNITLMTHFANADDVLNPGLPLREQLSRFAAGTEGLPGERSLSNSAAVLACRELASHWVRPGIMLYGATPGGRSAREYGLEPAMTLESEIIGVQQVAAGESIGYGSRFTATAPMTVGVVACGYADGYPRHAPAGTPVIVDGVRTVIAGRVSMDMITVDLTPVPQARVGSRVELWGRSLPIDEVAGAAGTIGYELMCAVAPRVRMAED